MSHLTGNQFQICDLKYLFIISVYLQAYGDNTCILIYLNWSLLAVIKLVAIMQCLGLVLFHCCLLQLLIGK